MTKLNWNGSALTLVYNDYLGGTTGAQWGYGIAADSTGSAYFTGSTFSRDFPVANPVQGTNAGGEDAFVTELSAAGNALIYSTYLGGSNSDVGTAIAVSANGSGVGSAYITGWTQSVNFPTANTMQGTFGGGGYDAFVAKLNWSGSALTLGYSTYLGGSADDVGTGIAVDSSGDTYVTGNTASTDFLTSHAILGTYAKNSLNFDAFVAKINPNGNGLIYSTYLGGSGNDMATGIAVDAASNAYVTGSTTSTDFPLASAYQSTNAGTDAFVTEINAVGNAFVYSTYLGGSNGAYGYGIGVDNAGNTYVTGRAACSDFPTLNPVQSACGGGVDAFVTKLHWSGSALTLSYSTYLGGSSTDVGYGIAVDSNGNAYVTGYTTSSDFPVVHAIQSTNPANANVGFVARIAP